MTHREAILSILEYSGVTKRELARRCDYPCGTTAIDPRLRSDIRLSTLRHLAEALGYEVALVPRQAGREVYVLDEDIPSEQRCRANLGMGKRGPVAKKPRKNKKGWTSDSLFKRFGMEEV